MSHHMEEFNRRQIERGNSLNQFAHINQAPWPTMETDIYDPRKAERQRCIAIIEEEISRGKSFLGLLDHKGKPIYSDEAMTIGIEVLEYVRQRIMEME